MAQTPAEVYIAGPFFNPVQIETISKIETLLANLGIPYYSPRLHSGSADMTPEQRRDPQAWVPVFNSNIQYLTQVQVVIAVVSYEIPDGSAFGSLRPIGLQESWSSPDPSVFQCMGKRQHPEHPDDQELSRWPYKFTSLELPDTGTVYEMGFIRGHRAAMHSYASSHVFYRCPPCIGFHPTKLSAQMNLMLTHGVDGFITGHDDLLQFFHPTYRERRGFDTSVVQGWKGDVE